MKDYVCYRIGASRGLDYGVEILWYKQDKKRIERMRFFFSFQDLLRYYSQLLAMSTFPVEDGQ